MQSAQAAANDSGWGISASAGSGDVDDGEVGGDSGESRVNYDDGGASGGGGDINRLDGVSAGDDGAADTKTYSRDDSGPVEAI